MRREKDNEEPEIVRVHVNGDYIRGVFKEITQGDLGASFLPKEALVSNLSSDRAPGLSYITSTRQNSPILTRSTA